jgi:hypothetical protein
MVEVVCHGGHCDAGSFLLLFLQASPPAHPAHWARTGRGGSAAGGGPSAAAGKPFKVPSPLPRAAAAGGACSGRHLRAPVQGAIAAALGGCRRDGAGRALSVTVTMMVKLWRNLQNSSQKFQLTAPLGPVMVHLNLNCQCTVTRTQPELTGHGLWDTGHWSRRHGSRVTGHDVTSRRGSIPPFLLQSRTRHVTSHTQTHTHTHTHTHTQHTRPRAGAARLGDRLRRGRERGPACCRAQHRRILNTLLIRM